MSRRSARSNTATAAASISGSTSGNSRRGKAGSSRSTSPMPGVLSELDPRNPSNLKRSLERNDVELAALSKLHVSLRILREAIIEEYGEDTLIEIAVKGQDKIGLLKDGPIERDNSLEIKQEENDADRLKRLSNAFLIRMKLRRRLLNRLARRLHRVAYILDGHNALAPYPPLYGDQVRRYFDANAEGDEPDGTIVYDEQVKEFEEREKKTKDLKNALEEQRRGRKGEEAQLVKEEEEKTAMFLQSVKKEENKHDSNDGGGEGEDDNDNASDKDDKDGEDGVDPDGEMATKDANESSMSSMPPLDKPYTPASKPYSSAMVNLLLKGDEQDEPLLNQMVEYEIGYDKVYLVGAPASATNKGETAGATTAPIKKKGIISFTKPITETIDEHEVNKEGEHTAPDSQDVSRVPFFPNSVRGLTGKDRAEEWQRWSKELCTKIPDQVTFDELKAGGESGVFQMELRLERAKALKRKREEDQKAKIEEIEEKAKSDDSSIPEEDGKTAANRGTGKKLRRPVKESDDESNNNEGGDSGDSQGNAANRDEGKKLIKEKSSNEDNDGSDVGQSTESKEKNDSGSEDSSGEDDAKSGSGDSNGNEKQDEKTDDARSNDEEMSPVKSEDGETENATDKQKKEEEHIEDEKNGASIVQETALKLNPKFFSLHPVPSFHDQDLFRIKNIQRELIEAENKMKLAREIEDKDKAYQLAFENSTDLNNRVNAAQQNLAKRQRQNQNELNQLKENNKRTALLAQRHWEKRQWERQQQRTLYGEVGAKIRDECNNVLQELVDRVSIKAASSQDNNPKTVVASMLGEMTLAVDKRTTEAYANHHKFVSPPVHNEHTFIVTKSTGETLAQMHLRVETQMKNDIIKLRQQFAKAEEHRTKCWNSLQNAKAAASSLKTPSNSKAKSRSTNRRSGGGYRSARQSPAAPTRPQRSAAAATSQSSGSAIPVGAATAQVSSQNARDSRVQLRVARPAAPANPNPVTHSAASAAVAPAASANEAAGEQKMSMLAKYGYGDRYSINNVNARKMSDGTVIPVSKPKQLENGRYARPSGRQRKNMDWDAVRGIWVPEGTLEEGHGE